MNKLSNYQFDQITLCVSTLSIIYISDVSFVFYYMNSCLKKLTYAASCATFSNKSLKTICTVV